MLLSNLSGTAKRLREAKVQTWMRSSRNSSIATVVSRLCQTSDVFLGGARRFVRLLCGSSTIYSCTLALTSLARLAALACLSFWDRLEGADDLLARRGLTSLAKWASLGVLLGHDWQESTVYFGTRALTSLAGLASLSPCPPELV